MFQVEPRTKQLLGLYYGGISLSELGQHTTGIYSLEVTNKQYSSKDPMAAQLSAMLFIPIRLVAAPF